MSQTSFTQSANSVLTWFRNLSVETTSPVTRNNPQPEIVMNVEKEMLLWKLIDGECTPEEEQQVRELLAVSEEMRNEYRSMLNLHRGFKQLLSKPRELRIEPNEEN